MRPFSNGMLVWVSALLSILVAVAGTVSKITKLTVSHDMLRRSLKSTIESQDRRISRLEGVHMDKEPIESKSSRPPE